MDFKLVVLLVLFVCLVVEHCVEADFYFNHVSPKHDTLEEVGLACVPGRTVIKIEERDLQQAEGSSSDENDEFELQGRRTHMNQSPKDENCKVCVCSVDGKDEYCSRRPAMNVNECIRMSQLMEKFQKSLPFEHDRDLSLRIRRDYIWHNDEIPYEAKASCKRGHSYYSNSINANDTDIDVASDIESLLDYSNTDVCYYCVCSVHGRSAGCISRSPWFCEYYRFLREDGASRDVYRQTFQQDRPTYFRQLSYRLRRTMDNGIFDLMESVGTEKSKKCIPFVSEYSDCTEENKCSCSKCTCTAKSEWSCEQVNQCTDVFSRSPVDDNDIDTALLLMENEIKAEKKREAVSSGSPLVPSPPRKDPILVQPDQKKLSIEDEIMELMRARRSIDPHEVEEVSNNTVKFYHTVDEINEDTLKNMNISGTVQAKKVDVLNLPKMSRRTGLSPSNNASNSLQIEYNKSKIYHHITDNKIDTVIQEDDKIEERIHEIAGNHSLREKDHNVSKLIVNEIKSGTETIGEKNAPVMSNITFTPENNTLTAMTLIAGNLLYKLWSMEKDASDESIEVEVMKHEKIADLLDLFKEPLTLPQEMFLKNALNQLSKALDKKKDTTNISLCANVEEAKNNLEVSRGLSPAKGETKERKICNRDNNKHKSAVTETVANMNNVLSLIQKYEGLQAHLNNLKNTPNNYIKSKSNQFNDGFYLDRMLSKEENASFSSAPGILEQITKLLMPKKNKQNIISKINNKNTFGESRNYLKKIRKLFNLEFDIENITVKDKVVLDYLAHIENNPGCILNEKNEKNKKRTLPSIEGDILLNLSEFFKMRSLTDLMQLIKPDQFSSSRAKSNIRNSVDTIINTVSTTSKTTTTELPRYDNLEKLKLAKEKLKAHLKTVLEDLIEIQNQKGKPVKNIEDIRITEVLPCLYNILNANYEVSNKKEDAQETKIVSIASVFENLKKELKYTSQTRRTNIATERPKSAVVWERVIKNIIDKPKPLSRRNINVRESKSHEELKKIIEYTESGSNTYKNIAFLAKVPSTERILLLKTLDADVQKYTDILENIKISLLDGKIPLHNLKDFTEFVDNVAMNINLNEKVITNLYQPKSRESFVNSFNNSRKDIFYNYKHEIKQNLRLPAAIPLNVKLTKDLILNQLIRNRIQTYIRMKETKENDLKYDIYYDIAKKILHKLESGNSNLARELYKVFASHKTHLGNNSDRFIESRATNIKEILRRRTIEDKEPIVQFEEPKISNEFELMKQDHILKQLLNIKT